MKLPFMKIYKTNENKTKIIFFCVFDFFLFCLLPSYGEYIAPEVFDIQGNASAYRDVENCLVNREKVFEPIWNLDFRYFKCV